MEPKPCYRSTPERKWSRGRAFAAISRYYRDLYGAAGSIQTEPYRLTALGAWARSRGPHVYFFFQQMDLSRYRLVLDLGSGDGMVACIAGLFTRAIGLEGDRKLCEVAQEAARNVGLAERVSFVCGDYLTLQIRRADCLYHYPDKPMYDLEDLLGGWRGDLLVYGPHFPPRTMVAIRTIACGREKIVLYRNEQEEKRHCVKPMHIC